jgi:hypothetical protein
LRNLWKRTELVRGIKGREMNSFEESMEEKWTSFEESKENTCWIGTSFNMEEDIGTLVEL